MIYERGVPADCLRTRLFCILPDLRLQGNLPSFSEPIQDGTPLADVPAPLRGAKGANALPVELEASQVEQRKRGKEVVAEDGITKLVSAAVDAKAGYPVIVADASGDEAGLDAGGLRNAWDVLRARLGRPGAVVLAAEKDGKPIVLSAGTPEAVEAGFDAGALIKAMAPHIKGGGGGKPAMAQAGGKDASGIDAALQAARDLLL